MGRLEATEDQDSYTETEDELVSLLHLDNRQGLNWLMKHLSLDYKSLLDYVYRDIIPEGADSIITCNNESETEEGC
jgi:hypothetical protein